MVIMEVTRYSSKTTAEVYVKSNEKFRSNHSTCSTWFLGVINYARKAIQSVICDIYIYIYIYIYVFVYLSFLYFSRELLS